MGRRTSDTTIWDETSENSAQVDDNNRLRVQAGAIDPLGNLVFVGKEHAMTHEGRHFFVEGWQLMGVDDYVTFAATPDAGVYAHTAYHVMANFEIQTWIYEGASVTGGTSVTPLHSNRNATATSGLTVVKDPTINDFGTKVVEHQWGEGTKGNFPGQAGASDRASELVLQPGVTYLFRVRSVQSDNKVNYRATWYEEGS